MLGNRVLGEQIEIVTCRLQRRASFQTRKSLCSSAATPFLQGSKECFNTRDGAPRVLPGRLFLAECVLQLFGQRFCEVGDHGAVGDLDEDLRRHARIEG